MILADIAIAIIDAHLMPRRIIQINDLTSFHSQPGFRYNKYACSVVTEFTNGNKFCYEGGEMFT
jgi:hypothetical protein